jgi:signal transduction histidine kinase
MNKLKRLFGFDDPDMTLENKLFNAVSLLIGFYMLLSLIINIFLGFDIPLNIIVALVGLLSAIAYYISRYKGYKENMVLIYVTIGIILFIFGWFYNGGIEGTAPQEGVFLIGLITILVTRKYHLFFIGVMIVVFLGCFFGEKQFPQLLTPPDTGSAKETAILVSAVCSILIIGLLIGVLKKSHESDKRRLMRQSEELRLSQIELSAAKDLAEAATFAKSNFLANMSHEIRTPLNGIIGTAQLLSRSALLPGQEELLQTLQSSSNLLINIISDILDLSKIEADKLVLIPSDFNIRQCIKTIIDISRPGIDNANKPINLSYTIDSKLADYVNTDESRLQQILVNLIGNAIKFTDSGFVTLKVIVTSNQLNMQQITFQISDSGIGISPEALEQLFKPFTQVNTTIIRKYGGTGLGLSICKKLVEMMGGKIWVESKEKEGSVFSFNVPLNIAKNVVAVKESEQLNIEEQRMYKPLRILLAEDNKMNQLIARRIFEKIGYPVDIADNGLLAIKKLEEQQYDLIFMDIQMPEMDGLQATRYILDKYGDSAPTIIAMTANVMSENELECKQAGMKDFLSKPFTIDRLETIIHKWG